jgi:UDP:flavonoid glycosyltransferase YjiC (YdhE family)
MSLALFFGTPEWGHTNPSLPLVAELIQRGDQIIYYSLEETTSFMTPWLPGATILPNCFMYLLSAR